MFEEFVKVGSLFRKIGHIDKMHVDLVDFFHEVVVNALGFNWVHRKCDVVYAVLYKKYLPSFEIFSNLFLGLRDLEFPIFERLPKRFDYLFLVSL